MSKGQRDRSTAVYRPWSETAARGATGGAEESSQTAGLLGMSCNAMRCDAMHGMGRRLTGATGAWRGSKRAVRDS